MKFSIIAAVASTSFVAAAPVAPTTDLKGGVPGSGQIGTGIIDSILGGGSHGGSGSLPGIDIANNLLNGRVSGGSGGSLPGVDVADSALNDGSSYGAGGSLPGVDVADSALNGAGEGGVPGSDIPHEIFGSEGVAYGETTGLDFESIMQSIAGGGNGGVAGNGYVDWPAGYFDAAETDATETVANVDVNEEGYEGGQLDVNEEVHEGGHLTPGMYAWEDGSTEAFHLFADGFDILSEKLCDFALNEASRFADFFVFVPAQTLEEIFRAWFSRSLASFSSINDGETFADNYKMTNDRAEISKDVVRAWQKGTFEGVEAGNFEASNTYLRCRQLSSDPHEFVDTTPARPAGKKTHA